MSTRRIAELAGVSPSAVSLALRNSPKVSAATRTRILKLAKRLGYQPNARIGELMSQVRMDHTPQRKACFGVVSLYPEARPWEKSLHLTRIHAGMAKRAEMLGYRLEPIFLRAPDMTYRRVRSILDARGIQGMLCFGSPDLEDEWPTELDHYAIVTQGLSIRTPLHRVVSHVYNDMWRALTKIHQLGYKRPGLVIGRYEEERSAHAYLCVYLGWSQVVLGTPLGIPVLPLDRVEEKPLLTWLGRYEPDVVIFVHHYDSLPAFEALLRRKRIRVPDELGVAAISQSLEGTPFSGLQENQNLIGAWAVELLVSRIINRDFGIPTIPRIEMVERQWIDGHTLKARRTG